MNIIPHNDQNSLIISFKGTYTGESLRKSGCKPASHLPSYETGSLSTKLVVSNPGPRNNPGLSDRLPHKPTSPHQPIIPHRPHYSAEQTYMISEKITKLLQKRAIEKISNVEQTGFIYKPLSCYQERRRVTANNQSQSPKQIWRSNILE